MKTVMNAIQDVSPTVGDAGWLAADLQHDTSWIVQICEVDRARLMAGLAHASNLARPLLDYRKEDFASGDALAPIRRALDEAQHGRGAALVKGLPREGVSEEDFRLLTWGIGLHLGVARPQDKATRQACRDFDEAQAGAMGMRMPA